MRGSHFSCELANKCLNVCEWVEVVERNKSGPCLPLLSQELSVCESVKENQIENENKTKEKKKEKRKFVEICAACMQSQQKRYNEGRTMVLLWCLNRKLNTVS